MHYLCNSIHLSAWNLVLPMIKKYVKFIIFDVWLTPHCIKIPHVLYFRFIGGHLGCLPDLCVTHWGTTNIHVNKSLWHDAFRYFSKIPSMNFNGSKRELLIYIYIFWYTYIDSFLCIYTLFLYMFIYLIYFMYIYFYIF